MELPQEFVRRMKKIFPDEEISFPSIKEFKTIRVNTIKISSKELTKKLIKSGLNVKKIDWYENGLIID
ncbi:MAG: hypothetical protein J7K87_01885, partial [Candidatus Aenigmarchaeota archaeon]|nr:hypothetical protein [Candidatus Aenigmarchaeota archaeon]